MITKYDYSKTYEIQSNILEEYCTLSFGKDSAMITCLNFSDLNTLMDICYIEEFYKSYNMNYTFVGEDNNMGYYYIIFNKKNKGDNI